MLRAKIPALFALCLSLVALGCGSDVRTANLTADIKTVSISPTSLSLSVNQTAQMQAVALLSDGTPMNASSGVVWSSASASVAAVSSQGVVICNAAGASVIVASLQGVSGQTSVNCVPPQVKDVRFASTPATIRSDSPFQYQLLADYSDGTVSDVTSSATWSTDPSVAYVSSGGIVACNMPGQAIMSATFQGQNAQASYACTLRPITPTPGFVESAQTFDGPFASWVNIKTAYGAKGDGVTDDTAAFQAALKQFALQPAVLWIPRGTYVITQPLSLANVHEFTMIGEDPLTTTIVWNGPAGASMLTLNGCDGFSIGRITWNGSSSSGVALDLQASGLYYPTRNLIHDTRIINSVVGVHDVTAETTFDRVHFDHNTKAGLSMDSPNALNVNVVDSLFTDNGYGVTNVYGAGTFNVSNSVFERSVLADMSTGNTGPFSFRNNLSVDSAAFVQMGTLGAPANVIIQGNTISNPTQAPIQTGTPGSLMLIDNSFININSSLNILYSRSYSATNFVSLGNSYSVTTPFAGNIGNATVIDDNNTVGDAASSVTVPAEIYVPPPSGRQVVDVAAGASGPTIQAAISQAVAEKGTVHLSAGTYCISQTLLVPVGADIAIVGDGALTTVCPAGSWSGTLLKSNAKSLRLEDIYFAEDSASTVPLISLNLPDVPSTHIFCDECATLGNAGWEIDGLDDASVEMRVATINGVSAANLHGGSARRAGVATLGAFNEFMTGSDAYYVDTGAHLLNEDGWHDTGQGPIQFVVSGNSNVTQMGGSIYSPSSSPAMGVTNFSGKVAVIGAVTNSSLQASSSASNSILMASMLGVAGQVPYAVQGQSNPVIAVDNASTADNGVPTPIANTTASPGTVEQMMAMARTQVLSKRLPLAYDETSVVLKRVKTSGFGFQVMNSNSASATGTYAFLPTSLSAAISTQQTCPANEVSLGGTWTISDQADGFVGLMQGGMYLSEATSSAEGGLGLSWSTSMFSARERWFIKQFGDGSFTLVNRATGDVVTLASTGCAYAAANSGTQSQQWLVQSGS